VGHTTNHPRAPISDNSKKRPGTLRPADVLAKQTVKEDLMTDVDPLTTEISHTRKVGSHVVSVIFIHELVERN
jgi:hypothetical protein